jgi:hypothetical protein
MQEKAKKLDEQSSEPEVNQNQTPATENPAPANEPESNKEPPLSISKPDLNAKLEKFKSKLKPTIAGVQTLQNALPHHKISDADDFVRLHPDEVEYWSSEYCFVNVPIEGQKRDLLHLIAEDVAMLYLPSKRIQRFRLALATKPFDKFFLCHVPSRNLDNKFNATSLLGCQRAKTSWVTLTSRKEEGVDEYKIDLARDQDAFPNPKWPSQSLPELVDITFVGRMIEDDQHPALLRLIGAKQKLG